MSSKYIVQTVKDAGKISSSRHPLRQTTYAQCVDENDGTVSMVILTTATGAQGCGINLCTSSNDQTSSYNVFLHQKKKDGTQEVGFLLYKSSNIDEAETGYGNINNCLSPLIDEGYVIFNNLLLQEILLPSPLPPEKLIFEIMRLMERKPHLHSNWIKVIQSLLVVSSTELNQSRGTNQQDIVQALESEAIAYCTKSQHEQQRLFHRMASLDSHRAVETILSTMDHSNRVEMVNLADSSGSTPLTAALENQSYTTSRVLVKAGATLQTQLSVAARVDNHKCIQGIVEVNMGEMASGTAEMIGIHSLLNVFDDGFTPLMIAVRKNHINSALQLLVSGADPNIAQPETGNTALHMASEMGYEMLVKALIAFGGRIDQMNKVQNSPVDVARNSGNEAILSIFDEVLAVESPKCATAAAEGVQLEPDSLVLLSFDGGGVRGLVVSRILQAIEKAMKAFEPDCKPFRNYFDYISGTSAGGMLALLMVYTNYSLSQYDGVIFGTASKIFGVKKRQRVQVAESFLKDIFGAEVTMLAREKPRVMVTGTLVDRSPSALHLFKNFGKAMNDQQSPEDQKVWEAARATSAAPFYFPPFLGKYVDGAVAACNPTLPAMVSILDQIQREETSQKLGLVISIGTGQWPTRKMEDVDVFIPSVSRVIFHAEGTINSFANMFNILINKVLDTDGQPVQEARTWCGSIGCNYFRLNTQLDREIRLDSIDCHDIVHMLYSTHVYILQEATTIDAIAQTLLSKYRPSSQE